MIDVKQLQIPSAGNGFADIREAALIKSGPPDSSRIISCSQLKNQIIIWFNFTADQITRINNRMI